MSTKIVLPGTNGDEPDDVRYGRHQIQRVYVGRELAWDYLSSAGRVTIFPPRKVAGLVARIPGRSVLPTLVKPAASLIARTPVIDPRRAVRVTAPRPVLAFQTRTPGIGGQQSVDIYPPKITLTLDGRVPVIDPRRAPKISVPRAVATLTGREPEVSISYEAKITLETEPLILLVPRIPSVSGKRAVTIDVPKATFAFQTRVPTQQALQAATIYPPKPAASLVQRTPEITTITPLIAAGLDLRYSMALDSSTWTVIPSTMLYSSWSAYPNTVRSGNGFRASGQGMARFRIGWFTSSNLTSFNRGMRVLINGVVNSNLSYSTNTQDLNNYTFPTAVQINDGDIITVEIFTSGSISTQRTFVGGEDGRTTRVEMIPVA